MTDTFMGGQLNIADVPLRKIELRRAVEDLEHAAGSEGVELRLGEAATTESVLAQAPDALIVAVGASSFMPTIPGVDGPNVCDAWKVLAGEQEVNGLVAVVGGGVVACETSEYLAEQGCKVSMVEMFDKIGGDVGSTVLPTMLENYRIHGVKQYAGHKVTNIALGELSCEDKDGNTLQIPNDYVVIASGARPVKFDTAALSDKGFAVVKVGDCYEVADISHPTKTACDAASAL